MSTLSQLLTEARNPASTHIDELPTLDMLRLINDEDATVAAAVAAELPRIAQAVDAITARFAQGGRLFYIGAGTSGRLGVLDASECPPTFSVPPTLFQGIIAGGDPALRTSSEQTEDSL
ncbi:MAG: N-acetylmuramic acid 6-phosphate etherase, partial [Granulicella sp.]